MRCVLLVGGVCTDCVSIVGWQFNDRPNTYLFVLAVVVWSWVLSFVHFLKVTVRLGGSCEGVGRGW